MSEPNMYLSAFHNDYKLKEQMLVRMTPEITSPKGIKLRYYGGSTHERELYNNYLVSGDPSIEPIYKSLAAYCVTAFDTLPDIAGTFLRGIFDCLPPVLDVVWCRNFFYAVPVGSDINTIFPIFYMWHLWHQNKLPKNVREAMCHFGQKMEDDTCSPEELAKMEKELETIAARALDGTVDLLQLLDDVVNGPVGIVESAIQLVEMAKDLPAM